MAEALAAGDLACSAGLTTRDELGQMGAALDTVVGELRTVMSSVVSSAEETSAQAGVVSGAAEEVSRSVETVAGGRGADGCIDPGDGVQRGGGR
jgi:methyl-accepting chemotaxis protein